MKFYSHTHISLLSKQLKKSKKRNVDKMSVIIQIYNILPSW